MPLDWKEKVALIRAAGYNLAAVQWTEEDLPSPFLSFPLLFHAPTLRREGKELDEVLLMRCGFLQRSCLFQSNFTARTVATLVRASVERNCWPHLRAAFPNHGGGCCQSSDKRRLSCYSPSSTCFKIKGPSLNPAAVTLYKRIFPPMQRRSGTFGCDIA